MRRIILAATAVVAVALLGGVVPSADASAKHYRSCKALNKDYPHGVGRKGARDKTSGKRVMNFTRNNKLDFRDLWRRRELTVPEGV